MQFPVPQFTEVEDKIIGSLTLKQFGIIFGVGMVVFLGYSVTKSLVVALFLFFVLGLPALGLALVPFNGRPMYNFIGKLAGFAFSPKQMMFHKEARSLKSAGSLKDAQVKSPEASPSQAPQTPEARLKELNELLSKTAEKERELIH